MEAVIERRVSPRTELSWPVSVWVPESNQFMHGRSANVSKTGALIETATPVALHSGQTVEVNFPRTETLAMRKGGFARIKSAKVVRVGRPNTPSDSQ